MTLECCCTVGNDIHVYDMNTCVMSNWSVIVFEGRVIIFLTNYVSCGTYDYIQFHRQEKCETNAQFNYINVFMLHQKQFYKKTLVLCNRSLNKEDKNGNALFMYI